MKKEKNKNQSFLNGFLADYVLTRRSFMKKASAATGTAVAFGSLRPTFKALAAAGENSAGEMGEWIAFKLQPGAVLKGNIVKKGKMWIWATIDKQRIPLLMRSKIFILGSVYAVLNKIELKEDTPSSVACKSEEKVVK